MRERKPKKVKGGLIPDKDLNVVTSAGFKAEKRARSVNRRAGLHDKKKDLEGEKRVSRRKPLALKHKRRMRKAAAALSAVVVGCVAFVGYGFIFKKPVAPLGDGGYETICLELPTDGAKPTSHTAVACVGYMNYALKHQQSWSSEFHATVNAMGLMSQSVSTYKEYYDSVLVSADLTTSSMVNNARQFCVADGRVIWREASGGKNTYAAMDTPWSEKLAGNYTLSEFRDKRGFPPTEFSVYVINEKTVLEEGTSEYAADNGDGTYSVTLHLNCVSPEAGNEEVNETSAVYYYVRQMLVTGGLTDYPVFKDVTITYTFDDNWRILSSEVSEDYAAVMGISASCSSDSLTEYRYDAAEQAKATVEKFYNGFFKQHMNTEVAPDDGAVTSALCLSNAFGSVLTEGAIFKVGVKVDELALNGVVSLDMADGAIGDVRVKFGDAMAYYGVYESKDTLFVSLGGSKFKINIEDLALGSSEGGMLDGLDTDALLEQLGGGDFEINAEGTKATLTSTLDIFGLKITLVFTFNIDGKNVTLDDLNATIPLGEKVIRATLAFGTEEDKPAALTDEDRAQFVDVINDGFTVGGNASLSVNGINVSLDINALSLKLKDGVSFKLDAQLKAGGRIFDIFVAYEGGKVTAVYGNAENNLGVTLNIKDGDLKTLSEVFGDVLSRIRAVIDEIVVDNKSTEELTDLESEIETADGLASVLSEVINILGLPADENGNIDVIGLINSINITTVDGKAVIAVGQNLALTLGINQSAVNFGLGLEIANATAAVNLNNLHLTAYSDIDCPAPEESILTANGLAEMLDYVASAAELLVEDEYSVSATASLFEDAGEGYEKTSDVNIIFEYIKGESFPVQVKLPQKDENGNEKTPLSVTLRDDMYWHLAVNLVHDKTSDASYDISEDEDGNEVKTLKDDLYIDVYILDAKPATQDGKTLSQAPEKDGGLDIFLVVSKYADAEAAAAVGAKFEPLKVYAPVDEVLTILAAGAAVLDLQGIDVSEQSGKLQDVIDTLGVLIDDVLIKAKLPYTHSQFSSLGASLLPQFLGKDLSSFLKDMLSSLSMEGEEEENETPVITDGNFIGGIKLGVEEDEASPRLGDTKLSISLNSAAIYGSGFDNLEFNAYKANRIMSVAEGEEESAAPAVAHSKITGAAINNIYYGGNKRVDVGLNISREVEKLSEYGNFYDFSGIDTLLNALVNSATHAKSNATASELAYYSDPVSGVADMPDYILNHYYYIEGSLSAQLNVLGDSITVPVNIDLVAVSVTIDEKTNDVAFNVRLHYNALAAEAAGAKYIAIKGESYVDLTVKNGMLYIRRTQLSYLEENTGVSWSSIVGGIVGAAGYELTPAKSTTPVPFETPVITYRAMPLSSLGSDMSEIMDLLSYVLNLDDKIVDIIVKSVNGSGTDKTTVSYDDYDYGTLIGTYLQFFTESVNEENGTVLWTLSLNGQFLTDMLGMKTSNPVIKIGADFTTDSNGDRVYVVKNLAIENTTIVFVESPEISMTISADLTYGNPQLEMREGYVDETVDLSKHMDKTLNVTYVSDIAFAGVDYVFDGSLYKYGYSYKYGDDSLFAATAENANLRLLGWFAEIDGEYVFVADIDALKTMYFYEGVGESSVNVTLYAVWVESLKVTVNSSSYRLFTLKASGSYVGGGYAAGLSSEITTKMNMVYSAGVELCSSSNGVDIAETWSKKFKNGTSFDISNTAASNTAYAGAKVTITYSVNGKTVATLSDVAFRKT